MERLKSIYQANPKEKISESTSNKNIPSINNNNAPKKLNLQEIFKGINIAQATQKIRESSGKEAIIISSHNQKEEEEEEEEQKQEIPEEKEEKKDNSVPTKINEEIFLQSKLISKNEKYDKD